MRVSTQSLFTFPTNTCEVGIKTAADAIEKAKRTVLIKTIQFFEFACFDGKIPQRRKKLQSPSSAQHRQQPQNQNDPNAVAGIDRSRFGSAHGLSARRIFFSRLLTLAKQTPISLAVPP
jgi:hypothetical protein